MRRNGQPSRPSARTCCRFSSLKTLLTRRRVSPRRRQCPAGSIGRFCGVPHWPVLGVPPRAQPQQLAVNALCAPARVVAAHHPSQIANLLGHSGSTGLPTVIFHFLEQAETLAVPGDDHLRLHDIRADFQSAHTCCSQTQKIRSADVSSSRLGAKRRTPPRRRRGPNHGI